MDLSGKLKFARQSLSKTQNEMADLAGCHLRSWQGYEQGKIVPGGEVFKALAGLGFNVSWFFADDAKIPMRQREVIPALAPTEPAIRQEDVTEVVNIQELLNMTAEVLTSKTVYRPALAANIKAFHRSIALEHDNQELRIRVDSLETRLEALERGQATPEKKSKVA